MQTAYTIFPLGDSALTIDFGNRMEEALNEKVIGLYQRLQNYSPAIIDLVPAYSSLTVYYDFFALYSKNQSAFESAKALIEPVLLEDETIASSSRRQLRIPVCYATTFALDIEEMANHKNLSIEAIIQLHTSKIYRVYMICFLPGFAYMGKVHRRLITPRKNQPRTVVPAGAVGITGEQTGIYPFSSPGGWNIIGRTPLKLFDSGKAEPVFCQPGDEVQFYSITEDEFENYQSRHS